MKSLNVFCSLLLHSHCSQLLSQQLALLARAQHHVCGTEPKWGLLVAHELPVHHTVIARTAPGLKLAITDGTFEAAFVH